MAAKRLPISFISCWQLYSIDVEVDSGFNRDIFCFKTHEKICALSLLYAFFAISKRFMLSPIL